MKDKENKDELLNLRFFKSSLWQDLLTHAMRVIPSGNIVIKCMVLQNKKREKYMFESIMAGNSLENVLGCLFQHK